MIKELREEGKTRRETVPSQLTLCRTLRRPTWKWNPRPKFTGATTLGDVVVVVVVVVVLWSLMATGLADRRWRWRVVWRQ